ncbi:MAG: hypothetical protein PQJ58_11810, partial [Spirochaetales bacterium]|nr:hypothetical protein [Spirochaetales bacterium]
NPASVAVSCLDTDNLKKELGTILEACRKNRCHADLVLKDISTICHNPENLIEWEKTAMEMAARF